MTFIHSRTGEVYSGEYPDVIESFTDVMFRGDLLIKPFIIKKGDPGFEDELVRYMFHKGYIVKKQRGE